MLAHIWIFKNNNPTKNSLFFSQCWQTRFLFWWVTSHIRNMAERLPKHLFSHSPMEAMWWRFPIFISFTSSLYSGNSREMLEREQTQRRQWRAYHHQLYPFQLKTKARCLQVLVVFLSPNTCKYCKNWLLQMHTKLWKKLLWWEMMNRRRQRLSVIQRSLTFTHPDVHKEQNRSSLN